MVSVFDRFKRSESGNFAVLGAILAMPVVLSVGMAVDVSTVVQTRSKLQSALDAAALSMAREGVTLPDAEAQRIAEQFVRSNFGGPYSGLSVTRNGTAFRVDAEAPAQIAFGGLFGYKEWPVKGTASADIAYLPYEIALVLDTTGSMRGGKLAAMKEAVLGLVDTMSANVKVKENLKFAMVPFSSFVNVGPQFAPSFDRKGRVKKDTGADWLDIEGKSDIAQVELKKGVSRFEVFHNLGEDWKGCVETRQPTKKVAYDVTDAPPGKKAESLFVPAISIDEPDAGGYQNSYIASSVNPLDESLLSNVKKLQKYGLVGNVLGVVTRTDNSGPGSMDDDALAATVEWAPVASSISAVRGPNASCQTQPIVPLSTDYEGIKAKVRSLEANGTTNITEGVAWGWRVLSPGEPFTEGAAKNSKTRKVAIVLTDGSNVFGIQPTGLGSSYSSFGFAVDERLTVGAMTASSSNELMNVKTLAACTNAKADGIEIFTIRLEEPNLSTGMMLKDCASGADHFFDAPSRSQLDEVFEQIRDRITRVRVSS